MKNKTVLYLSELCKKVNNCNSIYTESNNSYNDGYLAGKKIATKDILSAIEKLEDVRLS